jgi:hypothetical protein
MRRLLLVATSLVLVSMVLGPGRVFAHHSFAAEYIVQQKVILKGTISKMVWVNPHGWLYIDASEIDGKPVEGGKAQPWALEFGSPVRLLQAGIRRTDLPVGSIVTVEAYRAKNGSNTANASRVILANGQALFAGSSAESAGQKLPVN